MNEHDKNLKEVISQGLKEGNENNIYSEEEFNQINCMVGMALFQAFHENPSLIDKHGIKIP